MAVLTRIRRFFKSWPFRSPGAALLALLVLTTGSPSAFADKGDTSRGPNIVLILADDMAYSDLGAYGAEIDTPHLDALAKRGAAFTQFHVAPMCSPTRAMLMTGVEQHKTGYGSMEEFLADNQRGQPGYEGALNDDVVTIARLLRDGGYRTYMTGKWHLGMRSLPSARGFDETYILVDGAGSHFDDSGYGTMRPKVRYRKNGKPVVPPEDFYSSDFYTDQMIRYIEEGQKTGKPFFGYLSFTAPHWPLHAPEDLIEKYIPTYQQGWDALRAARFKAQKERGIIDQNAVQPVRSPTVSAWDSLSPDEQRYEAKTMAVYAAMIERLDWNVGRLMAALERMGAADETIVVFLSDNGPEAIDFNSRPIFPPATDWIKENFGNRYETLGGPRSYIFYGERWAQAGASAHRYYKTVVSQGGLHVPFVLSFPGRWSALNGAVTPAFASVLDIAPTLLSLAGIEHPGTEYKGRRVHAMDGRSMVPFLDTLNSGGDGAIHPDGDGMGFELFGHESFIDGSYKIMRLRAPYGDNKWRLFDIKADPGELKDLSRRFPERFKAMLVGYEAYKKKNGVIPPPADYSMFPDPDGGHRR